VDFLVLLVGIEIGFRSSLALPLEDLEVVAVVTAVLVVAVEEEESTVGTSFYPSIK
jgi:hypothetical protein